jgi:NitT/TauT family transport system permease protein
VKGNALNADRTVTLKAEDAPSQGAHPHGNGMLAAAAPAASPSGAAIGLLRRLAPGILWGTVSIGLFASLWEAAWALGWANPLLLPPPHIFLQNFVLQGRFFSLTTRTGNAPASTILLSVTSTIGITTIRVLIGLFIGFVISLTVGVMIRYFQIFGNLTLPMITLLAPISPVAWLPVAIFAFGIGNVAAVFLVFIALFFIMTLATISEIDQVNLAYLNVARIMGASRSQILFYVILPAILPGLFLVLRLNLFAAWMIVLIGEAIGVGSGLGQVVMLARNTFNSSLTFFTMTLIGIVGYSLDIVLLQVQRRLLYWIPQDAG